MRLVTCLGREVVELMGVEVGVGEVVGVVGGVMFQYMAAPFHSQRVRLVDWVRVVGVWREVGGR